MEPKKDTESSHLLLKRESDITNTPSPTEDTNRDPPPPNNHVPRRGFRSIPYQQTIMANQPRLISTITDHLPGPSSHGITFPTSFKMYKPLLHWKTGRYIGLSQAEPVYRVSVSPQGLILHSGPRRSDPMVASIIHKGWIGRRKAHVIPAPGLGPVVMIGSQDYSFTITVPAPGGYGDRPETFYWRRSRGPAVRALGTRAGWKLIRLSTDAGQGGGDIASGGGEVVAVYRHRRGLSRRGMFMFQGSGAQGILGEMFPLMAVMTALGIWDHSRRSESVAEGNSGSA